MFYVNGNPLLADEQSILEELRRQLAINGFERFRHIKSSGTNLMVTCPFHSNGQERKPSCGISTVATEKTPAGTVHCFTCGYTGSLDDMISGVFGYEDMGDFGRQWLAKNFLVVAVESRKPLELNMGRYKYAQAPQKIFVPDSELDLYRYYHPYMYQRGLTDEIIEEFDIGYDAATECITFPVLDINKNCVFVARRSVKYKFFNYPQGVEKPVYAAYKFMGGEFREAIICESFLNALTCWKYGKPAVALIGTGTESQYKILQQLPVRKYILGFDCDKAGNAAWARLRQHLSATKILTQYNIPPGKDLNDLDSEIMNLQELL